MVLMDTTLTTTQLNALLATAQAGKDVEASNVPQSEERDMWFAKFTAGVEAGEVFWPVSD